MRVQDLWAGGVLHLQDHRDVPVGNRSVPRAARVEARDEFGRWRHEGHEDSTAATPTLGDLSGGFFVAPFGGRRDTGLWSFALPAITTEAAPEAQETGGHRAAAKGPRLVRARAVRDQLYGADARLEELRVALPEDTRGLPEGTPLVVLATTREDRQELLGLPIGEQKLIAVNAAGDPRLGTFVYDLDAQDKPDVFRRAYLHTFWRVMRLGAGCHSSVNNALAWQLTVSGQDGLFGRGLVVDDAGPATVGATPKKREHTPPGVGEGTQVGAVTLVSDLLKRQRDALRTRTRERAPEEREREPTRPRDPGDDQPPVGGTGLVVASVTARASGFLEVGDPADVHRLGTTIDGEPLNAAHLSTLSLWKNDVGDGPMEFDPQLYEEPQYGGPFFAPVHLRWDPGSVHDWVCGEAPGLWRWEAESFFYIPEDRSTTGPPWQPPPSEPPPPPSAPPPKEPKECQRVPEVPPRYDGTAYAVGTAHLWDAAVQRDQPGTGAGARTAGAPEWWAGDAYTGGVRLDWFDRPYVGGPSTTGEPAAPGTTRTRERKPGEDHHDGGESTRGRTHEPTRPRAKQGQGADTDQDPRAVSLPPWAGHGGQDWARTGRDAYTVGHGHPRLRASVLRALQAAREADKHGRPTTVGAPRVGTTDAERRRQLAGTARRVPTLAQTVCAGGAISFKPFATAPGEPDFTGGGWIQREIGKQAAAGSSVALFAVSTPQAGSTLTGAGTWESLRARDDGTTPGALVLGNPLTAQPENVRRLLDGDYHPLHPDAGGPGPGASLFLPGGVARLYFAHPSDTSAEGVTGPGSVYMEQTAAGLQFVALTSSGSPSGDRMLIGEGGIVLDSGKTTVTGRLDPTTLELSDLNGAASPIPLGNAGLTRDDTVDSARPLWTDASGTRGPLALLSDVGSATVGTRAYNSVAQSIPDATWTTIALDSEDWDPNGYHSTATNNSRITPTQAGKYLVTAAAIWATSGADTRGIRIRRNGTTVEASHQYLGPSGATPAHMTISTVVELNGTTDYVEAQVFQGSGSSISVQGGSYADCGLAVQRLA